MVFGLPRVSNLFITASATVLNARSFFFALVLYILHKVSFLRLPHFKFHHDCSFEVGSSRCAIASEGGEALFRDLLSATVPTYIIGLLSFNFYGYLWVLYCSFYSFWAMYVHTGVHRYHALHHGIKPHRNYGLYYITDFFHWNAGLKTAILICKLYYNIIYGQNQHISI